MHSPWCQMTLFVSCVWTEPLDPCKVSSLSGISRQKLWREFQFLCVALAVLEVSLWTRLTSNSQRSTCLSLQSAGIKDVCHHCQREGCYYYYVCLLDAHTWECAYVRCAEVKGNHQALYSLSFSVCLVLWDRVFQWAWSQADIQASPSHLLVEPNKSTTWSCVKKVWSHT